MAKGRILRLRGLPWSAGAEEVVQFLKGHPPVEVFLRRRGEKSTGEAFVEYETAEDAAAAQAACNNKNLGPRYIEIFLTDADSMKALKGEVEEHDTGWVVRLRGLPFNATAEDVQEFFAGLDVVGGSEGIVFTWGRDGRPLGEAYVELATEQMQQEAMRRDRNRIGQRYIEVFKSTRVDMRTRNMRQSDPGGGDWHIAGSARGRGRASESGLGDFQMPLAAQAAPSDAMESSTLRLRGLPYSATVDDVVSFFAEFNVQPEAVSIAMGPGKDGQPQGTGLAYVSFSSPEEAEAARSAKHRKSMGSRYIECLPLYPPARAPMLRAGPMSIPAGRNFQFVPRGVGPMASVQGRGVMGPHQGVVGGYPYEGQGERGMRPRPGRGMPQPYGLHQPPQMIPIGVAGPQPFPPQPVRGPAPASSSGGSSSTRPPSPGGRGGPRRGSRIASPSPPVGAVQSGSGTQLTPAEYQQMMMQHQFLMQQQAMMQQQMGHLRPAWGMPHLGGPFVAPYPAALRPQPMQAQPQQPRVPYMIPAEKRPFQPPAAYTGPPRPAPLRGAQSPAPEPDLAMRSQLHPPPELNLASQTPSPALKGAVQTFPLSPGTGPGQGASPASSLQSELQSLTLGSRSQSLSAGRAASGAAGQPASLQSALPHSPHSTSHVPGGFEQAT